MPSLAILLALGAITSIATADNIYTYTKPNCTGPAFFFKDIDHNICAVTITGNATNIADAIAKGITTVQSGKLEVQETGRKHFLGWGAGPGSNENGPLQCGTVVKNVTVSERETCISSTLHGFSWTEPGADGEDSKMDKRQDNAESVWKCTGSTSPNGVFIQNKHYTLVDIELADRQALIGAALHNMVPSKEFDKYVFNPSS